MQWVDGFNNFLILISSPFNPWVQWSMDPVKFPINSFEIYFISMILSVGGYVAGSLLTYRPYDLDKLLHRGRYRDPNEPEPVREAWAVSNCFRKLVGVTPEYTLGDKIIAYSVFGYSVVYSVILSFVGVIIFNLFYPWPKEWWTIKFLITALWVPGIIAVISTVWFLIGGVRDAWQLFVDLEKRAADPDDNGQVLAPEDKKS